MASDCASVIPMMEVDVVCSCRDLASHTSYVGVGQATLLQHLEDDCQESPESAEKNGWKLENGKVELRFS